MNAFIDAHREEYGVEPICRVLQRAPSTYSAARCRPPSARAIQDEQLKAEITRVFEDNYRCYGVGKMYHQPHREGHPVARCRVRRLTRELGIHGLVRGKTVCTTRADQHAPRPDDLVGRDFHAPAPNRLWVADLTYIRTWGGWVYAAFVIDVYSRTAVGWQLAPSSHRRDPRSPWVG